MIQLPIIGSLLEATGMIIEKKLLKQRNINFRNYTTYGFFAIMIVSLPFLYFFWNISPSAFEMNNLMIFFFVVLVSTLANLLIFYSLKREKISEFEHVWVMQPLFTVLLAFLLFPVERNFIIMIFAFVASLTLVLSHVKKHHLQFDKYILAALAGSFLFAVELVSSKFILDYYSPFTFYFLRCSFIFVFALTIFRPSFRPFKSNGNFYKLIVIAAIWLSYRVIVYYGYLNLGVVFTTIIFTLSPVFLFILAVVFLKEKPSLRQIVSTIVIVGCVAGAIIFGR